MHRLLSELYIVHRLFLHHNGDNCTVSVISAPCWRIINNYGAVSHCHIVMHRVMHNGVDNSG